jgi:hypothetical protein
MRDQHREPGILQRATQRRRDERIVLDDQDATASGPVGGSRTPG